VQGFVLFERYKDIFVLFERYKDIFVLFERYKDIFVLFERYKDIFVLLERFYSIRAVQVLFYSSGTGFILLEQDYIKLHFCSIRTVLYKTAIKITALQKRKKLDQRWQAPIHSKSVLSSNFVKIYLSKSTLRIKIRRTVKKLETILVLEGKKSKEERKRTKMSLHRLNRTKPGTA
jgi:hypothetical protein